MRLMAILFNPPTIKRFHQASHGAAMLYVLALLVIMSTSLMILFKYTEIDNKISAKMIFQNQTELLSESGLSFALAKLNSKDTILEGLNYTTRNLEYWVEPPNKGFALDIIHHALFSNIYSRGVWSKKNDTIQTETKALVGQMLNLEEFPALCLTNKQGTVVLAGTSSIEGDVLLWNGNVETSDRAEIRYKGKIGHIGAVLDSLSPIWEKVEVSMKKVDDWIKLMEKRPPKVFPPPAVIYLTDTVQNNAFIKASKKIVVTEGTSLYNSELSAPEVVIQGNAKLNDCIVYASRSLRITGFPTLKGQFMSSDSLYLNLSETLIHYPVFYVHGRIITSDKGDTSYTGFMDINKVSGRGIFLFGGHQKRASDPKVNIRISSSSIITGLIYANGNVNMGGTLYGSLICNNLRFRYKQNIYFGHLFNGQIKFIKNSPDYEIESIVGEMKNIPAPLIFKNLEAAVLKRELL